jgi:hypothetical protein
LYSLVILLFIETEQQNKPADDTIEEILIDTAMALNSLAISASGTEV